MRERLSDEEIRAAWEVLQDDAPEPRHPWQWPSYEAGVRWAEDQYREALLSDLSTEDLVDARRSNSRVYDVAYSAGFLAGARVEHREAPQRREAPGLPRPVLLRVAREGAKGAAVCWTMDDVVRFVRDIRGGVFGVWSDITVEPWEAPAEPTANRLQQRREAYDAYYLANKARQPNNSPTRVLVASTFLDGWDAAEASRDPAVLSYLVRPGQGEAEASRPQAVGEGLPPMGSRWVSPTYGTGVVVKTRHNEDRADELWIRFDGDKLKQPLWCTIPSFYNYHEYDFSQPGLEVALEPADDPGDAPRRAQVEFDPGPWASQPGEPRGCPIPGACACPQSAEAGWHWQYEPEQPEPYRWRYVPTTEQPAAEPWALQSETCACRLDSTGLHLCADSAGDVEILMRRHVWDALLSQCPLTLPPSPPEPTEPDWPAWWATMSVDLTQMRIGSPQIREGARARRFIQEIRDDGTVKLTPVVGGGGG